MHVRALFDGAMRGTAAADKEVDPAINEMLQHMIVAAEVNLHAILLQHRQHVGDQFLGVAVAASSGINRMVPDHDLPARP